jgi:hypothetical protein
MMVFAHKAGQHWQIKTLEKTFFFFYSPIFFFLFFFLTALFVMQVARWQLLLKHGNP